MVLQRFREVVQQTAAALGCHVEIDLHSLTPAVQNNLEVTQIVRQVAEKLLPEAVIDNHYSTMGSEDMALFMQKVPGCYFFIGSANHEKGLNAPHHHPHFDIDESALPVAAALMSAAEVEFLNQPL
jgi:amidohydrolase